MKKMILYFNLIVMPLCLFSVFAHCEDFQWIDLNMGGECESKSSSNKEILKYLESATSISADFKRKSVKILDNDLFEHPFISLSCAAAPRGLSFMEILRLRKYLISGGTLFINNRSAMRGAGFDKWVQRTANIIFSDNPLMPVPRNHPVLRSFFLISEPGGRFIFADAPEVVNYAGRSAIIYSKNDLLGIWPKDALNRHLYECVPGGERQRENGKKLLLNIIMYGLTGSYKLDAVHQPYILRKLRMLDAGK